MSDDNQTPDVCPIAAAEPVTAKKEASFSKDELVVISGSLNEILNGAYAVPDFEFQTILGFSRQFAQDLQKKTNVLLDKEEKVTVDPKISIDDFAKVEMRLGTVLSAEPVEGSEKLLKLSVDFGEASPRRVISGIAKSFTPESLVGTQRPFVTNLAPRPIMGFESRAMILAAKTPDGLALLSPSSPVAPGTRLG